MYNISRKADQVSTESVFDMPIKVLLVDIEYRQFLHCREMLASLKEFHTDLLWCGELEEANKAIRSAAYDLVILNTEQCDYELFHELLQSGSCTPLVALTGDEDEFERLKLLSNAVIGVLNPRAPDLRFLRYFLLQADMHRRGEFSIDVLSDPLKDMADMMNINALLKPH